MSWGADPTTLLVEVLVAAGASCQKGMGFSSQVPDTSESGVGLRSSACSKLPCMALPVLRRNSTFCEQSVLVQVGAVFFCGARFLVCGNDGEVERSVRMLRTAREQMNFGKRSR